MPLIPGAMWLEMRAWGLGQQADEDLSGDAGDAVVWRGIECGPCKIMFIGQYLAGIYPLPWHSTV